MKESILSVGIDIGTSTTQLVFSRITIENTASMISVPRIKIADKEVIYRSDIHFTPLKSTTEIDGEKVRLIVKHEYEKAGVTPEQVQTGAVIITGETARKENAAEVQKALSHFAGEFVVATAGPALEGIIAGKGANASGESKKRGAVVANLDIGGGTTNIAVFDNGEVIDTSCLDIGGRLIKVDGGKIAYISEKMKKLAESNHIPVAVGQAVDRGFLTKIAMRMSELLEEVMGIRPATDDLALICTDKDLRRDYTIDYVTISGGVADCLTEEITCDTFLYGDIGLLLGQAIAHSLIGEGIPVLASAETIGATVVGAGSHTTDISGSTISVSCTCLPLQNIPVLKLSREDEALPFESWGGIIRDKVAWYRLQEGEKQMPALAFKGPRDIGFEQIHVLAESILEGMDAVMQEDAPLTVVVENDLAKALGQTLQIKLGDRKEVICIDTVKVENGDYIDIGRKLAGGNVVPVIVKTLLFSY
ncbi:ethanolamine ammonia-lyase reactivating factor EutA [Desulfoluna spongiiphila]|uniref:Reactivating factor of Adenosylcobalamin-dependent ethanolamine ammonia lyase n=1 Tax=Desulfoluna spongiiphila TaxID=419481 RepID=A0A1G5E9U3_9BACT|nr:ethanolamine ammonia-lyase reactivating factor EutA [Desulfoluna spongiiphila]SCY23773.1 Reactivating factor of Adenosylcobalamin-dependent ethanolamine ammonia lyase [Desulfoluna spongiiphila]VVS91675.1 ethanolamine utilisation euta [Desulfoluna spongiiphila]